MKIRSGFVSNSSSSSFVVNYKKVEGEKIICLLKPKEQQLLTSFGFELSSYSFGNYCGQFYEAEPAPEDIVYGLTYVYEVSRNQDRVVTFLLQHKIPFIASIEYDTHVYLYDGKSDYFLKFLNSGTLFSMYYHPNKKRGNMDKWDLDQLVTIEQAKTVERISIKEYLNENKSWLCQ